MQLRYEKCMKSRVFTQPMQKINEQYMVIDMKVKSMEYAMIQKLEKEKVKAQKLMLQLDALSPLKTLARGYGIISKDGQVVKSVKQLNQQDEISIQMQDGKTMAKII